MQLNTESEKKQHCFHLLTTEIEGPMVGANLDKLHDRWGTQKVMASNQHCQPSPRQGGKCIQYIQIWSWKVKKGKVITKNKNYQKVYQFS